MKCHVLIASLPVSALNYPPAAPALLKACVEQSGFTAKTADFSQSFFKEISQADFLTYDEDSKLLQPNVDCGGRDMSKINQWLDNTIASIRDIDPAYIGLSIFSYYMHRSAFLLARRLRTECPQIKIVIGGYGSTQPAGSLNGLANLNGMETLMQFNRFMKQRGLCDHFIIGEGEDALVRLLDQEAKTTMGMSKRTYTAPVSNFEDYDLVSYNYVAQTKQLPITGSKGCVRKCTFCDVPTKFGRFKYRSGKDVAREILELKAKHGISNFSFTDSLVNGSLSSLEEMTTELAGYNNSNPDDRIQWNGQYISRPRGQTPERIYRLLSESGAEGLTIGLESGSNRVLEAMRKKVKIEDVNWEMEIFDKYRISTVVLMMFGYYNETEEDFQQTIDTIIRFQKYVASGTMIRMDLGHPLGITSETELYERQVHLGLDLDESNPLLWTAKNNPGLDFRERVRRRLVAQVVADRLAIPTGLTASNMRAMLTTVRDSHG